MGRRCPRSAVAGGDPAMLKGGIARRCAYERDHELSIPIARVGGAGGYRGVAPRSKVSMTIMGPPQHGQG